MLFDFGSNDETYNENDLSTISYVYLPEIIILICLYMKICHLCDEFFSKNNHNGDSFINPVSLDKNDYFQKGILKLWSEYQKWSVEKINEYLEYLVFNVNREFYRKRETKTSFYADNEELTEHCSEEAADDNSVRRNGKPLPFPSYRAKKETDFEKREERLQKLKKLQRIRSEFLSEKENNFLAIISTTTKMDEIFDELKKIYPDLTPGNARKKKCDLLKKIKNIMDQINRGEK